MYLCVYTYTLIYGFLVCVVSFILLMFIVLPSWSDRAGYFDPPADSDNFVEYDTVLHSYRFAQQFPYGQWIGSNGNLPETGFYH